MDLKDLSTLPPEKLHAVLDNLAQLKQQRVVENRLSHYKPYKKQTAFHAAGAKYRERLLCAANQSGKTMAGGMECSMHATGKYPEWWAGCRFDQPTVGWVAGTTNETVRDTVQRILVGRDGEQGTGTIPKSDILELVSARGIPDLLDSIKVRHVSGGVSVIGIKSYQRGRESFQGETLHYAWCDEEPDIGIYTEILTRTNVQQGPVWMTFTPILGMSETARRFLIDKSPDRHVVIMSIDDVAHFTPAERKKITDSYPAHEREARVRGIPSLGSGRVFPIPEESITVKRFDTPKHWARVAGIDFGWTHPTAAVLLEWDRDNNKMYITKTHRMSEASPVEFAAAVRPWGARLWWAWPKDGARQTLEGAGLALAKQFQAQGLNMLHEHAKFEDERQDSVEAGLMLMLDLMKTGCLKVFSDQTEWFEEFRMYHRREGKLHKESDDLMAASRYAIVMKRFAEPDRDFRPQRPLYRGRPGGGSMGWMGS